MQKLAHESGQSSHEEATGLSVDPKMGLVVSSEELMFMRKLQVYHEVLGEQG